MKFSLRAQKMNACNELKANVYWKTGIRLYICRTIPPF